MTIKPYKLQLKKVSIRDRRLLEAVLSYLPATGMRERFPEALRQAAADEIGESVAISLESIVQEGFASYVGRLPRHPIVIVIGAAPGSSRIFCEIDPALAMLAVERMLGGHARSLQEPRMLSETEQGIVQYLVARLLAETHAGCAGEERVHFRFERFALSSDELRGLADEGVGCAVFAYRVVLGRHAGFVRLVFPEPFAGQAMHDVESPYEHRRAEAGWRRAQLERYSYVQTPLWAEAGRITITPQELAQVEEGDVILLEGGDIALSGGSSGRVVLRVGSGLTAGIDATVELDTKRARASVIGIHRGE